MKLYLHEILQKASEQDTPAKVCNVLRENDSIGLRDVLRCAYDEFIEFEIPEGSPPYNSNLNLAGEPPSSLDKQTPQLAFLVKHGKGGHLPMVRREKIWTQILESIHPKDAEILIAAKDKKLLGKFKGVTPANVKRVWPDLIVKYPEPTTRPSKKSDDEEDAADENTPETVPEPVIDNQA